MLPEFIPADCDNVCCAVSLLQVSESSSWWARSSCLEFLQMFVFHNMATILSKQVWVQEVRSAAQGKIGDVNSWLSASLRHSGVSPLCLWLL
jgi:hypothetical protein